MESTSICPETYTACDNRWHILGERCLKSKLYGCSNDASAEVSPQVLQMTSIFAWVCAEMLRSNNNHFFKSPSYFNAITPFKLTAFFI